VKPQHALVVEPWSWVSHQAKGTHLLLFLAAGSVVGLGGTHCLLLLAARSLQLTGQAATTSACAHNRGLGASDESLFTWHTQW
jgi:hypothetical protein